MNRRRLAILLFLSTGTADACGEYFGTVTLDRRQETVLTMWDTDFAIEAERLIEPPSNLHWKEPINETQERVAPEEEARQLRRRLLQEDEFQQFEEIRESGLVAGQVKLASIIEEYAIGAHHYDARRYEQATVHFEKAAANRQKDNPWPLLGQFMLAKSRLRSGENPAAAADFLEVVRRVQDGSVDPIDLAHRSLSEAATAFQRNGDWIEAIEWQMRQTALGIPGSALSLRWRIESALENDDTTRVLLRNPVTRDAIILYAASFLPEEDIGTWGINRHGMNHDEIKNLTEEQIAQLPTALTPGELVAMIHEAVQEVPITAVKGIDKLAVLLYRQGRYDDAMLFAQNATTPLGKWVNAKLAVRSGNLDAAAEYYSQVIHLFPIDEYWTAGIETSRIPFCKTNVEAGTLALRRGDLLLGMELFLRAGSLYWHDTAYLAERVLTIEELKSIVNRLPGITISPTNLWYNADFPTFESYESGYRGGYVVEDPRSSLKDLLARRLMRSGAYAEAIPYFSKETDRAAARSYARMLELSDSQKGIEKAKSLFAAAMLVRRRGMEIMGFDASPDWSTMNGRFSSLSVLEYLNGSFTVNIDPEDDQLEMRRFEEWQTSDADWIGSLERARVRDSSFQIKPRFTYRLTAAELANRAADFLPNESHGFAAVLCRASSWLIDREPTLARKYYARYLAEGRSRAWATEFGRDCESPKWP